MKKKIKVKIKFVPSKEREETLVRLIMKALIKKAKRLKNEKQNPLS